METVYEFLKMTASPVKAKELFGRSRKPQVVAARHAWWYYMYRKGLTRSEIAEKARRGTDSVNYGIRHAKNMLDTRDAFFACYRDILLKVER